MNLSRSFVIATIKPDSGKPMIDSEHLKAGLAGAVILDFIEQDVLNLGEDGRLHGGAGTLPVSPVLQDCVERADGRKPKSAIARIGGGETFKDRAGAVRQEILEELAAEGVATSEEGRNFGVLPATVWRLPPQVREEVAGRVEAALEGTSKDGADYTLAALLHAAEALPKVLPHRERSWVKRQGKAVAAGDWASTAVKKAVQDVQTAVIASVTAATAAMSVSSH